MKRLLWLVAFAGWALFIAILRDVLREFDAGYRTGYQDGERDGFEDGQRQAAGA